MLAIRLLNAATFNLTGWHPVKSSSQVPISRFDAGWYNTDIEIRSQINNRETYLSNGGRLFIIGNWNCISILVPLNANLGRFFCMVWRNEY